MGFFDKLKQGLEKTRTAFSERVNDVFGAFVKVDEELFEELEEALIMADVGMETSMYIIEKLRETVKRERITEAEQVKEKLCGIIADIMRQNLPDEAEEKTPEVILVIGVNGVGKTTTIGKLASFYKSQGKSIMLAAADTFRAAAIDQLKVWAERSNCEIIAREEGSDPSSVVFDALAAAKSRGVDVLICDTAGRLHNKKNLMDELGKIGRIITREAPDLSKHVFLVLDATTGQNAISQAKLFGEAAEIDGIVLTKLDGTAKGGVVIGICREQSIPVRFVGVGEGIDDMQPFDADDFAKALF
ncbi:MAG: signal recognition particle-docking protein FtsY [Ruminococcaceae bacterium]|nr:signal recognition particle-docking protein FtsY [Oscillospiraceae bacterium]